MDIHLLNLYLSNNSEAILREENRLKDDKTNENVIKILCELRKSLDTLSVILLWPHDGKRALAESIIVLCDKLNQFTHYQKLAADIKKNIEEYLNPDPNKIAQEEKREKQALTLFQEKTTAFARSQQLTDVKSQNPTASAATLINRVCGEPLHTPLTQATPNPKINTPAESIITCTIL